MFHVFASLRAFTAIAIAIAVHSFLSRRAARMEADVASEAGRDRDRARCRGI